MQIVRLEQKRPRHELEQETFNSLLDPGTGSIGSGSTASSQMTINANGTSTPMPSGDMGLNIAPGTLGTWSWSINYGPVVIDNKTFWLPMAIDSATGDELRPSDRLDI